MKNIKKITISHILIFISILVVGSCTDLEPSFDDSVPTENEAGEFTGINPEAVLNTLYTERLGQLNDQANSYSMQEVSSDELVVVTRGADWGDNGAWRTMHQHTWRSDHPHITEAWKRRTRDILLSTQIIAKQSKPSAEQAAEAKVLRAISMFYIMDLFGQVPFREVDEGVNVNPRILSRPEAFDFIVKDLNEALPDLPEGGSSKNVFKANKSLANFLLAKLFINKEVYTGTASAEDYTKVVKNVDEISKAGYTVNENYFEIFFPLSATNDKGSVIYTRTNKETILAINVGSANRVWNVLHPEQGGWNGFATLAEVYDSFESTDKRLGTLSSAERGFGTGMLIGQQYSADKKALADRQGNPLIFTKTFPDGILRNDEKNGVRPFKYTFLALEGKNKGNPDPKNYYVWARYSDAILMKAEAILRGGASSETAESILDAHRTIRGALAKGSYTLKDVSDERRRELYIEGWRRNDQIRFKNYNSSWDMKENTDDFRVLFPIPINAAASNPNLEQNPGY